MKKVFRLENLGCANCAAKMEKAISKIEGVSFVSIGFMTRRFTIEADESSFDMILEKAQKIIKKYENDCKIVR
ncbi:MAG: cation transporter [Clostridia bacterium]|nr:cation transporter [Clostridia bacterium]